MAETICPESVLLQGAASVPRACTLGSQLHVQGRSWDSMRPPLWPGQSPTEVVFWSVQDPHPKHVLSQGQWDSPLHLASSPGPSPQLPAASLPCWTPSPCAMGGGCPQVESRAARCPGVPLGGPFPRDRSPVLAFPHHLRTIISAVLCM